ncbi:hypothetical protein RHMOL_Rhmol02G0219500 [Rhododendron molle]|uniref:Uncharacterized protein n=1 Tax=Rhododendron molle TaxID=49168 RepID=A0ACC0PSK7_RHOML|nr:hypothetical protein RHMOL_Rhmol02G0219500 [Rhododendron molle]
MHDIRNRNSLLVKKARKCMELGAKLGVIFHGSEDLNIMKYLELEEGEVLDEELGDFDDLEEGVDWSVVVASGSGSFGLSLLVSAGFGGFGGCLVLGGLVFGGSVVFGSRALLVVRLFSPVRWGLGLGVLSLVLGVLLVSDHRLGLG